MAVAAAAIAENDRFSVALAGGATPAQFYRRLAMLPYRDQVDWSRVDVYFGDERAVPPDHPDSNYRMACETLLDAVAIPPENIHRMAGELLPPQAARNYRLLLRRNFGLRGRSRPRLDLILLGLGADGHTASLFPCSSALDELPRQVVATDAPAYATPAIPRITLTLPVLNAAAQVWFLVTGAAKAPAVRAALADPAPADPSPARRVRPASGALVWWLDAAAAGELGG